MSEMSAVLHAVFLLTESTDSAFLLAKNQWRRSFRTATQFLRLTEHLCVGAKHSSKVRRRDTKTTLDLKAAPLVTVDSVILCGAACTFGTYRAWSGILIIL